VEDVRQQGFHVDVTALSRAVVGEHLRRSRKDLIALPMRHACELVLPAVGVLDDREHVQAVPFRVKVSKKS
jgi:hypothetical protein